MTYEMWQEQVIVTRDKGLVVMLHPDLLPEQILTNQIREHTPEETVWCLALILAKQSLKNQKYKSNK